MTYSKKSTLRESWFWIFFPALFLLFFTPFFSLRTGLAKGDYALQFYPWLHAYAQGLKQGHILLWTPLIQCGYPLFAEGQTGMLYWLNLLFFRFLDTPAAMNLSVLTHYFFGGFFAYFFARKKRLSRTASTAVSLVFVFGSASAGGYLNIVSLRTHAFFPLILYLADEVIDSSRFFSTFLLAFFLGQSWLAGSLQTAFYQEAFLLVYLLSEAWVRQNRAEVFKRACVRMLIVVFLAAGMALPQVWASLELAAHSSRTLQESGFAFWGSVAPWSVGALLFYFLNPFFGINFYIGFSPLLFIFCSPGFKEKDARIWWILFTLSIFFAFGKFNPLNLFLTHSPIASLVRNPSKLLFFSAYFLTMIAGFSIDRCFLRLEGDEDRKKIDRRIFLFCFLAALSLVSAWFLVSQGQELLRRFGEWYVHHEVLGRSFHRGDSAFYASKLASILSSLKSAVSFSNRTFWVVPVELALVLVLFVFSQALRKGRRLSWALLLFLSADLLMYGAITPGTSFRGNIGEFPRPAASSLPKDARWYVHAPAEAKNFQPNKNMLLEMPSVGVYAPLVDKNYYLLTRNLGVVDDSLGISLKDASPKPRQDLLDFLGVKYQLEEETLTTNPSARPEFYGAQGEDRDGLVVIPALVREGNSVVLTVESPRLANLIRSETYDTGWRASVDGENVRVERFGGVFQSIVITPGRHRVEWFFDPSYFSHGFLVYLFSIFVVLLGLIRSRWCREKI